MAASIGGAKTVSSKSENGEEEPGAAPYGNFANYYRFNPPGERLRLIPAADLVAGFSAGGGGVVSLALDVGCNSGEDSIQQKCLVNVATAAIHSGTFVDFSVAIYKHLCEMKQNLKLLSCDIDADLIQRATESNPYAESILYVTLDIMDPASREAVLKPYLDKWHCTSFDICFCMSVTMWIHLHHGDQGLLDFLLCLSRLCKTLLIEPQPWKCYRSAARRLRKLGKSKFDHFKTLSIKGDVAQKIHEFLITDCNMELVQCFGNTNWNRSLLLFKKCSLS